MGVSFAPRPIHCSTCSALNLLWYLNKVLFGLDLLLKNAIEIRIIFLRQNYTFTCSVNIEEFERLDGGTVLVFTLGYRWRR